jgi:hypothetical protein
MVGAWRPADIGLMQVVSGPIGRERVHFEAPPTKAFLSKSRVEAGIRATVWLNQKISPGSPPRLNRFGMGTNISGRNPLHVGTATSIDSKKDDF